MSEFWKNANGADRWRIREEMLRIATRSLKAMHPEMSNGAAQVKAAKAVDAAIQKEARDNGTTDHINAQQPARL